MATARLPCHWRGGEIYQTPAALSPIPVQKFLLLLLNPPINDVGSLKFKHEVVMHRVVIESGENQMFPLGSGKDKFVELPARGLRSRGKEKQNRRRVANGRVYLFREL